MQGSQKVLDCLNALLTSELTAADQYFAHSRMLANWGLHEVAERISHERDDELAHADKLLRRILFLNGRPDVGARNALNIGANAEEMLRNDLAYELMVVGALKSAIVLCEQEQDFVSREVLVQLLDDTENDHTHWLEQQLHLISLMGLSNYMQSAAGDIARSGAGAA